MSNMTSGRRWVAVPMVAVLWGLAFPASASAEAERSYFFEETAEAGNSCM
jgi:hypothetical protein